MKPPGTTGRLTTTPFLWVVLSSQKYHRENLKPPGAIASLVTQLSTRLQYISSINIQTYTSTLYNIFSNTLYPMYMIKQQSISHMPTTNLFLPYHASFTTFALKTFNKKSCFTFGSTSVLSILLVCYVFLYP